MRFTILTLFPEFIEPLLNFSIIKRAINKHLIEINIVNFRDFSTNKTKRVDDYQIGGGEGMVLQLQPIVDCLRSLPPGYKVAMSPQGHVVDETYFKQLAKYDHVILICGHYEGFDERLKYFIDDEASIGDYVLTNGELPAMVILDGVSRLVQDVIKQDSHENESFEHNLLDYPVYAKPDNFEGYCVPAVLLSGNHELIAKYKKEQQIENTKTKRPDLYLKYLRGKKDE